MILPQVYPYVEHRLHVVVGFMHVIYLRDIIQTEFPAAAQPLRLPTQASPCLSECKTREPRTPLKWRLKWVILQEGNIKISPGTKENRNFGSKRQRSPPSKSPKGITTQRSLSPLSRWLLVPAQRLMTNPPKG